MAVSAYGLKVVESAVEVRYEVRRDDPRAAPNGVLVISKASPRDDWKVEGEGSSVDLASIVGIRVLQLFEETGEWPERAFRAS